MSPDQRVLFVCLGNICRSPAAEGMFRHQLSQAGLSDRVLVDSAGTAGWHVGKPADPRMRAAAARRGLELTSRARQLELGDFSHFDHILTMDDENLEAVQKLAARASASGLNQRAEVAPLMRYCSVHKVREVPDPYYGGDQGFEHVLDLLDDACAGLLAALSRR